MRTCPSCPPGTRAGGAVFPYPPPRALCGGDALHVDEMMGDGVSEEEAGGIGEKVGKDIGPQVVAPQIEQRQDHSRRKDQDQIPEVPQTQVGQREDCKTDESRRASIAYYRRKPL